MARRPELIGQEIDGFLFVEEVASGASSTVYRALQRPVDDRLVAVKVLDAVEQRLLLQGQDDLNPLWREARFSQTVRHPAIVRIFTTGRLPDGRYYVAMEFVDGHTLEVCWHANSTYQSSAMHCSTNTSGVFSHFLVVTQRARLPTQRLHASRPNMITVLSLRAPNRYCRQT